MLILYLSSTRPSLFPPLIHPQEPAIALLASQYLAIQLPGILAYSLFTPLTKLLEVLGLTSPLIAITAISFSFLIACNCLLIYGLHMGFLGAAYSFSLTLFLQLIVTLAYIYCYDYSHGLMRRCFPFLLTPSHSPLLAVCASLCC